jgi:ATP-dependent DNA helicase RecG
VVEWTEQKVHYIRNRGDDDFCRRLIIEYLQKYAKGSRKEMDEMLFPNLPEVLTREQKEPKVKNLLQVLRRGGVIRDVGQDQHQSGCLVIVSKDLLNGRTAADLAKNS